MDALPRAGLAVSAAPREELEALAWRGDAKAQFLYANALEEAGENEKARRWLKRAIASGSTDAKAALGARLLTRPPFELEEGVALTRSAAEEGDAEAAHLLAVLLGSGLGVPQDWQAALDWLARAAELGHLRAQDDLSYLGGAEGAWRQARARIDLAGLLAAGEARPAIGAPRAFVVENFVPPELCARIIARGKSRLAPAKVIDAATGDVGYGQGRSNSDTFFNLAQMDLPLVLLRARIAALTGLPVAGMEAPTLFHYEVGQEFALHYDFLDADYPGYARALAANGTQRVLTFLLYLNDGYEGGETDFPLAGWRYKGRAGDALFFWNVEPTGLPDRQSLHAGLPPSSGEKFLLSQWIQGRVAAAS
jgi:hypothetical protein